MSRIDDGGAVEAGLVEQSLRDAAMVSLAEEITWGSSAASRPVSVPRGLLNFAAAEITRLRAEVERKDEALARLLAEHEAEIHNEYDGTSMLAGRLAEVDFARAALSKASQAEGQTP